LGTIPTHKFDPEQTLQASQPSVSLTKVSHGWIVAENPLSVVAADLRGLLPATIPQPQDLGVGRALQAWAALAVQDRVDAARSVTEGQSLALLGYGERQASQAVRDEDAELIFLGLLALGVDDWRFDYRDNLVRLALHYDAASRLGLEPDLVFEQAAALLPPRSAQGLRSFVRREPEDRSLKVMGWQAGTDEQGFRYVAFRAAQPGGLGSESSEGAGRTGARDDHEVERARKRACLERLTASNRNGLHRDSGLRRVGSAAACNVSNRRCGWRTSGRRPRDASHRRDSMRGTLPMRWRRPLCLVAAVICALPAVASAADAPALGGSGSNSEVIPANASAAAVTARKWRRYIENSLVAGLKTTMPEAKIVSCPLMIDYREQTDTGKDWSWGAVCNMNDKGKLVIISACNDYFIGKYSVTAEGLTRDQLILFIAKNCEPGG
jgi:hypothetical protein